MSTFRTVADVTRLTVLLACVALATTRVGLVGHELVGHGGTALAVGARIDDVRLFWFAGGWIHYDGVTSTAAGIAIAMGGIAIEWLAAGVLWLVTRGDSFARRIVRAIGCALAVHGGWYLATGTWHGYGDGALLYHLLGGARYAVAILGGAVACVAAYAGARTVLGALAMTIDGSRRARMIGTIAALAIAGGFHAALLVGELAVRRDTVYAKTMQPERARVVEREIAAWDAQHAAAAPAERQAVVQQIERTHRTFPFAWLLGFAVATAILAGAVRARAAPRHHVAHRELAVAALAAIVATGIVIAIGAM